MRLAAFQMVAEPGNVPANLGLIADAAREAKAGGADVIVAPELALTGYGAGEAVRDLAEPADGKQVAALAEMAVRFGIAIVAGFAEREGEAVYSAAALVDPGGRRVTYRKCQLYGDYEKALFTPGATAPRPVELLGMKVGLLVCYDVEFPEMTRHLAQAGAELMLVPTALPMSEQAPFIAEKLIPARAFENQCAIVYADHAGSDQRFAYGGRSCIVMPDGQDAARAPADGAALLIADYQPDAYAASRSINPYLDDRRSDLF